jgi:hypothetical protein
MAGHRNLSQTGFPLIINRSRQPNPHASAEKIRRHVLDTAISFPVVNRCEMHAFLRCIGGIG